MNRWLIIVNPKAAAGQCTGLWPRIERTLKERGVDFEARLTAGAAHASAIAHEAVVRGVRNIATVGGDGTANEAVNGLFAALTLPADGVLFAHLPVGTGNDWGRTIGIPSRWDEAITVLKRERGFIQDTCRVEYTAPSGKRTVRYFVNVAGMGYDAAVCDKTNRDKERGRTGKLHYVRHIFSTLLTYMPVMATVTADEETITGRMLSLNVGICRCNGGGCVQVPHAVPDDGLLGLTIIGEIGTLGILTNVKGLRDGSFVKHPKVRTLSARRITVETTRPIPLEADGESLGTGPFIFEVVPRSLKVAVK